MYHGTAIGVVIPAFNEQVLIGRTLDTMPDYIDWIVVVDDASTDATADAVRLRQATQAGRLTLIRHDVNRGVGAAIATGNQWCRDQKVQVAVVMAGDAQMNPDDLPRLLEPVLAGEIDYAKGNRLFTGEAWSLIPRTRYLGNAALSLLTKIASGYWHIADSQSGYTATTLKVLETIDWTRMYPRYGQPNDLLVRLNVFEFRVRDVPVSPVYNIGERAVCVPSGWFHVSHGCY